MTHQRREGRGTWKVTAAAGRILIAIYTRGGFSETDKNTQPICKWSQSEILKWEVRDGGGGGGGGGVEKE